RLSRAAGDNVGSPDRRHLEDVWQCSASGRSSLKVQVGFRVRLNLGAVHAKARGLEIPSWRRPNRVAVNRRGNRATSKNATFDARGTESTGVLLAGSGSRCRGGRAIALDLEEPAAPRPGCARAHSPDR